MNAATTARSGAAAVDRHVEAAPRAARGGEAVEHDAVRAFRKARVGVQEEERVAGASRAGVHLRRAAARRGEDAVGERRGERCRAVRAAAVDDDHLGTARAKRRRAARLAPMPAASFSAGTMIESRLTSRLSRRDRIRGQIPSGRLPKGSTRSTLPRNGRLSRRSEASPPIRRPHRPPAYPGVEAREAGHLRRVGRALPGPGGVLVRLGQRRVDVDGAEDLVQADAVLHRGDDSAMRSPACSPDDGDAEDPVAAGHGQHLHDAVRLAVGDGAVEVVDAVGRDLVRDALLLALRSRSGPRAPLPGR